MRKMTTALVAATMLATTPNAALAFDRDDRKEWRQERRDARKERLQELRDARKEWRQEQRDARKEYRQAYYDDDNDDDDDDDRRRYRSRRDDWRAYRNYDYNRYDPRYGGYYADRYYRDGSYYQPRQLAYNDRIYRGRDGRYYCRRPDGTTGLILGGLAGGALGNVLAPGQSKTLGTVIGAVAGGLAGRALDRDRVTCR
jgi:hypothetical protein